jgi:transcriptional regulator with XRE-family HTH domain
MGDAEPDPGPDRVTDPQVTGPQVTDSPPNAVEQVGQTVGRAVEDIGGYIRSQREGAQVSMRQLAKLAGISNPYLSQVERGLRKPSAEILGRLAKGLRISAEVLYVQAGILEEPRGDSIVAAVSADADLTERQKQALLEIYQSFRRENGPGPGSVPDPGAGAVRD